MSLSKISTPVVAATAAPQARDATVSVASFANGAAAPSLGTEAAVSMVASHLPSGMEEAVAGAVETAPVVRLTGTSSAVAERKWMDGDGWNGEPVTQTALAEAFNARFYEKQFIRFGNRDKDTAIGGAYKKLYSEFAALLRGFSLKIDIHTSVREWLTREEMVALWDEATESSHARPPLEAVHRNPARGEMLEILNAMASRDRTRAVEWLYERISRRCQLGAAVHDAEVAVEKEVVKEDDAPIRAAEAAKTAGNVLESATAALVAELPPPITLKTLLSAISVAKVALGEEGVLDVRAVIVGLMATADAVPDEDDWEADADALDAPDVVAPIVSLYAAYEKAMYEKACADRRVREYTERMAVEETKRTRVAWK